jgi:hypothetical protein
MINIQDMLVAIKPYVVGWIYNTLTDGGLDKAGIGGAAVAPWELKVTGDILATGNLQANGSTSLDGAVVINESGVASSTRIESNNNIQMLVVDGTLDAVGIGGAAEAGWELKVTGDVKATGNAQIDGIVGIGGAAAAGWELKVTGDIWATGNAQIDGIVGIGGAAVAGVELTVTGDEVVTGFFGLGTPSTVTIAAGAVTATKSYLLLETEGGAATDDVDNINGGTDGSVLIVRAANSARTVVCKDSTGNLRLAGDCSLDDAHDTLTLLNLSGTVWEELARSNNA